MIQATSTSAPLADPIRGLRGRVAAAELATYQLSQVRAALDALDRVQAAAISPGEIPGADVLATLAPRDAPPRDLDDLRQRLQDVEPTLVAAATPLGDLLGALATARRQQQDQLDDPAFHEARAAIRLLWTDRDRLATEVAPLHQRAKVLPALRGAVSNLGSPHERAAEIRGHVEGVLAQVDLTLPPMDDLAEGLARLQAEVDVVLAEKGAALERLDAALEEWIG